MGAQSESELQRAMRCLPSGFFLMTAAHDGKRAGMRIRSVQACADEPFLISVAARKGHEIDPLIRDSRAFAVCVIDPNDRLIARSFSGDTPNGALEDREDDLGSDPFDALDHTVLKTGSPVLKRAIAMFDCEVARRIDLEADHELFVGQVVAFRCAPPAGV